MAKKGKDIFFTLLASISKRKKKNSPEQSRPS